jgi:sorbitol-specific phosphotransferase system component IIC
MFQTFALILLAWFLLSIPVGLLLGAIIAGPRDKRSADSFRSLRPVVTTVPVIAPGEVLVATHPGITLATR